MFAKKIALDPQPGDGGIFSYTLCKEGFGVTTGKLVEGGWPRTDGKPSYAVAADKFVPCPIQTDKPAVWEKVRVKKIRGTWYWIINRDFWNKCKK